MNPEHGLIGVEQQALVTDLYELTMAQAFHADGHHERTAVFDLYVRSLPETRGFLVAAGLEQALAYLRDLRFHPPALEFLGDSGHFRREFLDYLEKFRFTGDVHALPEGTAYFPPVPMMRVTAPIVEAQILETYLLTTLTFQTVIASKAARIVEAARGRSVVDFSPRRDHGPQAGLLAARASYIGGCEATSNVLANDLFDIPMTGTMAHSYVMFHRDEETAFRSFARGYPADPTLLIDTYDTVEGARTALKVLPEIREMGRELRAVRLDSGDLHALSIQVRKVLDDGGAESTRIFASGGLDEWKIDELVRRGAQIDGFGVGTELGTSGDAPSLDSAYKIVACENDNGHIVPVIKLSTGKVTLPGPKQAWRRRRPDGTFGGEIIGSEDENLDGEPLLRRYIADGEPTAELPSLSDVRTRVAEQVATLPQGVRRLRDPEAYPVEVSPALRRRLEELREDPEWG